MEWNIHNGSLLPGWFHDEERWISQWLMMLMDKLKMDVQSFPGRLMTEFFNHSADDNTCHVISAILYQCRNVTIDRFVWGTGLWFVWKQASVSLLYFSPTCNLPSSHKIVSCISITLNISSVFTILTIRSIPEGGQLSHQCNQPAFWMLTADFSVVENVRCVWWGGGFYPCTCN